MFTIIFLFGSSLNRIAIIENDCKMPVYDPQGHYSFYKEDTYTHSFFQVEEKYKINKFYLTDIFYLKSYYWSIGDFIQLLFFPLVLFFTIYMFYCAFIFILFCRKLKNKNI